MKKSKSKKHQPRLKSLRDYIDILLYYNPSSAYHFGFKRWRQIEELRMGLANTIRL